MKIGLIGSMYFIGLIVFITFVPPVADRFGRYYVFLVTNIVSVIAQLGLILTNDLYTAYFFEFLVGGTFAGRIVVGLSYILEYSLPKYSESIVFGLLITEACTTIIITIWYEFIDRGWFLL
jgi:MFS family permease